MYILALYILALFIHLSAFILTAAILTVQLVVPFLETPTATILEYAKIVGMISGSLLVLSILVFFGTILALSKKEV